MLIYNKVHLTILLYYWTQFKVSHFYLAHPGFYLGFEKWVSKMYSSACLNGHSSGKLPELSPLTTMSLCHL